MRKILISINFLLLAFLPFIKAQDSIVRLHRTIAIVDSLDKAYLKIPEKDKERFQGNGYARLFRHDKQIKKNGVFKNRKLITGKKYIYDYDGLLDQIEVYADGKRIAVMDADTMPIHSIQIIYTKNRDPHISDEMYRAISKMGNFCPTKAILITKGEFQRDYCYPSRWRDRTMANFRYDEKLFYRTIYNQSENSWAKMEQEMKEVKDCDSLGKIEVTIKYQTHTATFNISQLSPCYYNEYRKMMESIIGNINHSNPQK